MSEVLNRIINMTEATELSANDYVHIQSPTLGDRKIKANRIGGGGSFTKYLDNKLVGDTSETYFTVNLDEELEAGKWYVLALQDAYAESQYSTLVNHGVFYFDGTSVSNFYIYAGSISYRFQITATTIYLDDYVGSYRNIYATITEASSDQFYFPSQS